MTETITQKFPEAYFAINEATKQSGFNTASDPLTCSLLRTLAASKPGGKFLELGTGTGLSTAWILDGMDAASTLISLDNDARFLNIAKEHLTDNRLNLICADASDWLSQNQNQKFDFIFADTWHGKYLMLKEALAILQPGGLYIIDDMLPQPNWPNGHQEKALKLIEDLDSRTDITLTKMCWATGIIIASKR